MRARAGRAYSLTVRSLLSAAVTVVLLLATSGCGLFGSDPPEDTAQQFLDAFARGDTRQAARVTDAPKSAQAELDQARSGLRAKTISAELGEVVEANESSSAKVSYQLTWQLEHNRTWRYPAEMELDRVDDRWVVRWSPSVLHPELAAQHTLALREEAPDLAPVLDRDSRKLLAPGNVVSILLYPAEIKTDVAMDGVAATLSRSLIRYDDSITKRSILDGVGKVKGKGSYLVAALREPQYLRVKPEIYDLPGVRFTKVERLLAPTRDFGAQVLPGIRALVEKEVSGRAGWRVVAVDSSGAESAELHAVEAQPSEAVGTVLSYTAQESAERSLEDVPEPAAIVAMQASTGDILAVAQNASANEQGAIALTGRFPPGSTFKIATALSALSTGKVKPGSTVDCPGTTVIEGRLVPNDDRFELGKVPLSTAFARSCNTTFARLAADLPPDALTRAARDLGIGADFEIPGITTITGSAPPAENVVQQAENGFGQGKILASPFGMALAASTVAAGRTPTPSLLRNRPSHAADMGDPLPQAQVRALRSMMRKVVTEGTARTLASLPDVYGKTGTAQFGDGKNSHGWFVGYQGDLAFAVLLVGAGSSKPAVEAARQFLTGLD